jgi:hypothetical protein
MTTKIDIPPLSGQLDAPAITAWLATCEDTFEAWDLLNPSRPLDTGLRVLLAGLKLESPLAAQWWCENREILKKSTTWADFATAVKDRFVPASWRLDSLSRFYAISQGSSSFSDFLTRLQSARSALSGAGRGFTINDSMMKNHLLFNCNRILSLRICAIPTLDYTTLKLDNLIGLMSSTWNSMVAENVGSTRPTPQPLPPTSSRVLSETEREVIRNARGCFHCHKTPSSPGWIQHGSRNCPGDKSRGIPPRMASGSTPTSNNAIGSILPATSSIEHHHIDHNDDKAHDITEVLAVLPSCVLGNGTDSEGESDDD